MVYGISPSAEEFQMSIMLRHSSVVQHFNKVILVARRENELTLCTILFTTLMLDQI